mgnify:CR=1 FL=1
MLVASLLLLLGLVLLIAGGDALVRGSVALATRLRISPTIVGLTVVAFGTSTPELVVNLTAAIKGTGDLAFGNVVGSNIANIGLLLGVTALVRPLVAHRTIIVREVPMMLLVCLVLLAEAESAILEGRSHVFSRGDGLILLLLFGVFMYYLIGDALKQRAEDAYVHGMEARTHGKPMAAGLMLVLIGGGLAVLIVGGQMTVRGATDLAMGLGVPEVVIGLTLVAVGTSLPELATSVIAVRQGQTDIAIGNIVGSCIYNVALVFGATSMIATVALPAGGVVDLLVMAGLSALLLPIVLTHGKVSRMEGGLMLTIYAAYIAWLAGRSVTA